VLSELRITGLGVIDEAVLEPHRGLTVVTGETGAGKTMIVTALGLISGGRGDAARVRHGADRTVVEARLEVLPDSPAVQAALAAGGRLDEDGSIIAVRTVSADGRSRAHLGGRAVPLAVLAETCESALAIHGQSEAISLLRPAEQRAVLDRYADSAALIGKYQQIRKEWIAVRAELADRIGRARERAQREELLRNGLEEIARVAPLPGEDVDLAAEVRRLDNADVLRSAADGARGSLAGSEEVDAPNAIGLIDSAQKLLESSEDPRLAEFAQSLRQAGAIVADAALELSSYLQELDADPERLQQLLSRQSILKQLIRRYGEDIAAVLNWAHDARTELADLDNSEELLAAMRAKRDQLAKDLGKAAAALTAHRTKAAAELGTRATTELENLAMGRATLRIAVSDTEVSADHADALKVGRRVVQALPDGVDHVDILLTAHSGAPELPIQKGASGGELSRVMLALEVALAEADPVGTLVFDEVDAGVGGRAATEIGRLLKHLAATHQVIVVTHLAQVAAFADRHFIVNSSEDGAIRASSVQVVSGKNRELELARMLGGTEGKSARAHAADLLRAAVR